MSLQQWQEEGVILPIDRVLAEWMGKDSPFAAQAVLCFLSAAVRQGHLCVEMGQPNPCALIPEIPHIAALIEEGFAHVPDHPALVKHQGKLYFKRHFEDERHVWQELARIGQAHVEPIAANFDHLPLLAEQKKAAEHVCLHPLTLITGGPGTGKTTTCAHLVQTLKNSAPGLKIEIGAPTGKAAVHLERSLGIEGLKGKTLHTLLSGALPLKADLIMVDESSMIDASLMARLLGAVKTGARLVMLGDPDQLPPVGAGALFSDFVQGGSHVAALTQCMRCDLQEIVWFASAVKRGAIEEALACPISRKPLPAPKELVAQVCCSGAALLSPIRKGPYGVDSLNTLFLEHYLQRWDKGSSFCAPIMIAANNKKLELANGEVGLLYRKKGMEPSLGDMAVFGQREIPAALLPRFEYAWCLSVHKSQGSEFENVVLLLPEGSQGFGRKVLYTGATRARKSLEIWGDEKELRETIAQDGNRVSGFRETPFLNLK